MDIQARLYWQLLKMAVQADPEYKDYKVLPYKFIVVNRKNCKPMVWDFSLTEAMGPINIVTPTGYQISWRSPYVIGQELKKYLDENPELPYNVNTEIVNWLKTN